MRLRKRNPLSLKRHLFPHGDRVKMQTQGFLDLSDAPPNLEYLFQFFELSTKSGEKLYTPPPSPIFGQKGNFGGEGGGCIFWSPPRQEFYTPPLFYTPPTPRRVFSGWGGGGVYNFELSAKAAFAKAAFDTLWLILKGQRAHQNYRNQCHCPGDFLKS